MSLLTPPLYLESPFYATWLLRAAICIPVLHYAIWFSGPAWHKHPDFCRSDNEAMETGYNLASRSRYKLDCSCRSSFTSNMQKHMGKLLQSALPLHMYSQACAYMNTHMHTHGARKKEKHFSFQKSSLGECRCWCQVRWLGVTGLHDKPGYQNQILRGWSHKAKTEKPQNYQSTRVN